MRRLPSPQTPGVSAMATWRRSWPTTGCPGDRVPRARLGGAVVAALDARLGGLRRMTVKTPEPPPLPAEVDQLLRRLRMPYVRRAAPEVLATATAQRWEPAEVLRVLLAEEAAGRDRAT